MEYYSEIDLKTDVTPPRLDFIRSNGAPPPTAAMRALRQQIEDVVRLVNTIFQKKDRRDYFLSQLHVTADSGLRGKQFDIDVGLDNLQEVKNGIADAYTEVREPIWRANCALLVGALLFCAVGDIGFWHFTGKWLPLVENGGSLVNSLIIAFFLIPVGTAAGLFAEFLFRANDDIPYDQLRAINPGRWKPTQRAFNTLVVAWIFAGLLAAGTFQVGAANVLLNDFASTKPFLSIVIGFITGFAFPYVRDLVQQVRPVRRDGAG